MFWARLLSLRIRGILVNFIIMVGEEWLYPASSLPCVPSGPGRTGLSLVNAGTKRSLNRVKHNAEQRNTKKRSAEKRSANKRSAHKKPRQDTLEAFWRVLHEHRASHILTGLYFILTLQLFSVLILSIIRLKIFLSNDF